jgi:hypothetical protein
MVLTNFVRNELVHRLKWSMPDIPSWHSAAENLENPDMSAIIQAPFI